MGAAWLTLASAPSPVAAQEDRVPVLPAGVPVVIAPVQSARPSPDGSWPGGAGSMREAIEMLEAELAFAFGEEQGAEAWVRPDQVVDRVRRNPLLGFDPTHLAYQGLLGKPDKRKQLYEPLHGQLRKLAALFGARMVVVPLAVWAEAVPTDPEDDDRGRGSGETAAVPGTPAAPASGGGGAAGGEDPSPDTAPRADARPRVRAVLLLALVDVRRSAVLWHGTMEGGVGEKGSSTLLTSLALRVAANLSPS